MDGCSAPHRPESLPSRADNAEEQAKCAVCGDFFSVTGKEPDETATCPVCHSEVRVADALRVGVSNEDY